MIKSKVWRFYGFWKYSMYFYVFKFRIKILIAGNCNLKKSYVILFFIQLLKQSTRRSKNFLKTTSPAITHNPIFIVNFQLMSSCFGFPIIHSLTLNQTSLSIFILKSLKPIHGTNKKKMKKKKRTFHVARKAKRNKEASIVIVLGGWHVNLSGVGRGDGLTGWYRGDWWGFGRKRGWWPGFGPSGGKIGAGERVLKGVGGGGGFDSSKNCTFFSPIEWPGRHLNTLCVFHPWG